MGLFSKDIRTMDDLFVHTLRDIYYAEHQIAKALPKLADQAVDPALKSAFTSHLAETEGQIARLEKVFELHGVTAKGVTCDAIDGILKEAHSVAGEVADGAVLDAAMLAAAQAVEHYEISRYGTLVAWAQRLGRADSAALLNQTLREEEATDQRLTAIAMGQVNRQAA
ncbi:YciE/YciF ferroxidase family protein [Acuticoccus mangrovi]|uniref:Ferritin-like domain-containing protein n=1 Tax=Acuticoccus mangrovi TaxID=2796142 RepID=A0A934MBL9_9HYPH|nr:ferritin-like domain-containing protein [Acuticoccus mangrovi]MBJ3774267.1 ferritin-like domain-containing protein [Acuticoccus mangrovi]